MSMSVAISTDSITVKSHYDRSRSSAGLSPGIDYPILRTQRFQFRPFVLADVAPLVAIADKHRIADSAVGVPHPGTVEFARMCVSSHPTPWTSPRALQWAAIDLGDRQLKGYAGLDKIDVDHKQAELRFWAACGLACNGYATEWSAAMLEFAMKQLGMSRVYALQLARHRLAGRVLASVGMQQEGHLRKRIYKEGMLEDVICWAIVRERLH